MTHFLRAGLLALFVVTCCSTAQAQQDLQISIQNNQTDGGFYLTPLWFGIHDGSFDYFDANTMSAASPALQLLAEGGTPTGLNDDFDGAGFDMTNRGFITSPSGFPGAPVIDPGELAMTNVSVAGAGTNRYLSYASMVIPSNDAFIGNDDAMAHELFDAAGNFNGPITIQIFGNSIYDAGTEENNPAGDAAFSALMGTRVGEMLTVRTHPGLGDFVGTATVAGTQITSDILPGELLATITITAVPEPGSLAVLGFGSVALVLRRRKR